jgi:hypothetical protein
LDIKIREGEANENTDVNEIMVSRYEGEEAAEKEKLQSKKLNLNKIKKSKKRSVNHKLKSRFKIYCNLEKASKDGNLMNSSV